MEPPSDRWPKAIFEDDILEGICDDFESCQSEIVRYAESLYSDGAPAGVTAEYAAYHVGQMAYDQHKSDDYFVSALDEVDGKDGKKLAKGYIGIQAIREADC